MQNPEDATTVCVVLGAQNGGAEVCCGPVCLALIPGIPAALVAFTVGIAGWFIARHQAAVAEAKLKLDLFEKRYPIFQETWEIMSEVVTKGTRERNYGLFTPFNNLIPRARFLFGPNVEAYLSAAVKKWAHLHAIEAEIGGAGIRAADYAQQRSELLEWFDAQAQTGVKELFAPYLDFERWR